MGGFTSACFISIAIALALFSGDLLMSPENRKNLGRWCAIFAVIFLLCGLAGLGKEIIENWGRPGVDVSAGLLTISILVWGILVWAIMRYWKDAHRAEDAEREINSLKKRVCDPTFRVSKAKWGDEHNHADIADAINQMPANALAFYLCPDAFKPYTALDKADPSPGVDGKQIEIAYSFPGNPPGNLKRQQGQWIVLPEDPVLKGENIRLSAEVRTLKERLEPLERKESEVAERERRDEELRKNGPRVFVKYRHDESQKRDILTFWNDSVSANARSLVIEWITSRLQHPLSFMSQVPGKVEARGPEVECRIEVIHGSDATSVVPLWQLMQQEPERGKSVVRLNYTDDMGRCFYRDFTLSYRREAGKLQDVTWEPGQVCLSPKAGI